MKAPSISSLVCRAAVLQSLAIMAFSSAFAQTPPDAAADALSYKFSFQTVKDSKSVGLAQLTGEASEKSFQGGKKRNASEPVKLAFFSDNGNVILFSSTKVVDIAEGDSIFLFRNEDKDIVPRKFTPKSRRLNSPWKNAEVAVCQGQEPSAQTCFPLLHMKVTKHPFERKIAWTPQNAIELIKVLNGDEIVTNSTSGPRTASILIPETVLLEMQGKLVEMAQTKAEEDAKRREADRVAEEERRKKDEAIYKQKLDAVNARLDAAPRGEVLFCESTNVLQTAASIASVSYTCDLTGDHWWSLRDLLKKGWEIVSETRPKQAIAGGGTADGVSLRLKKL